MAIELHVFRITGISPLISHNPAYSMKSDDAGITAGKKTYDDDEEARIRLYKDNGTYYHPSAAIRSALLNACTGRKIGKRSAKSVIAGSVFPAEDKMTILAAKTGKPLTKYAVRKCRVKVGQAGVLRCRPQWDKWAMDVPIEVDTDFVTPGQVEELLNVAGRIIGIGDERPDTSKGKNGIGSCGRFTAELKT